MVSVYIVLSFVVAWAIAQLSKVALEMIKSRGKITGKELVQRVLASGGMPSGHTASFTAAVTTIGCFWGFDTVEFGLALCMLLVLVYDAINVRYAVGRQGRMMNKMVDVLKSTGKGQQLENLPVVEGHTLPEVMVGFLIGVLTGVAVFGIF